MSTSIITNRIVKPFIQAHDFYSGFKLEEECFSKAMIKEIDQSRFKKKSSKSDLDQEGPTTRPHEKSTKQLAYERFLEESINEKTGEFYPKRDENGVAKKDTGCTYFINTIYRIRTPDASEYLYTKRRAEAYNSLGDKITHSISMPEIWTKVIFSYKTEYNDKTKQMEKVLQGPSGSEEIYLTPFTKDNLKSLYDRRQNDLTQLAVKKEGMDTAVEVKDVTGNMTKSYELFRDQNFDYLINANYVPAKIKAEARMEAASKGLILGTPGDYNQPTKSTASTAKSTYQ